MFTIFDPEKQKWPIKVWLEHREQLEAECFQQAKNLSNLPFLHKWVSLMPDTHSGYGMPIGGVIATKDVIIPNAVGVDIGCGMIFIQTNLKVEPLLTIDTPKGKLAQAIVGDILKNIPTGFEHQKKKQECHAVDHFMERLSQKKGSDAPQGLLMELEDAYYQVGTLGSGNHFIELQADDRGDLGIMVHSGSRNIGFKICHYFNNLARELNKAEKNSGIPPEWDLAYLYTDSQAGQDYIRWMNLALDFAQENRLKMMKFVCESVRSLSYEYANLTDITFYEPINCHITMHRLRSITMRGFGYTERVPSEQERVIWE